MAQQFQRREFLKSTTAGVAALSTGLWTGFAKAATRSSLEKLNIACIGTANRAGASVSACEGENIVALVDVDKNYLDKAAGRFPNARTYADYREMFEDERGKIDAVTIGTADHHHAPASIRAIRQGLHVYCEKPLTHTVKEARLIAEEAKKYGVATQLGTQIHAGNNYRRVVEIIQAGTIGDVTDVHVWVGKGWGGGERPDKIEEPPAYLSWDLWLGPAPVRPYATGAYHPANWRRWWDFGQGTLGDMGCHYIDLPFWALGLRHPVKCEAAGPPVHAETCPLGLVVKYVFPAVDGKPPVNLTWYDGDKIPREVAGERVPGNGVMFVGTEGKMYADYGNYRLFPADKFKGFTPPKETIPNNPGGPDGGHHAEWIQACKEGTPTLCNFDYSGALTETVLLGNVAYRTGLAVEWDAKNLKVTNSVEANAFVTKEYRAGWEVA